ncbi:MAG: hypothetical protein HQL72_09390 [Magnetococcales bacterium]|nr:hypothetical protein [Magnetococcales bacterium]
MDTIGAAYGRDIQNSLLSLSQEAQKERLESAVSMIDELRVVLAEEDGVGSPTGYLTVTGWTKLLNGWDNQLKGASSRKIKYTIDFINEVMGREGMYAPPMGVLFGELKSFLEQASVSESPEIQVAA